MRLIWPILSKIAQEQWNMTDHGPIHADIVSKRVQQLSYLTELSSVERGPLKAAALLHDIGMIKGRDAHGKKSHEMILEFSREGELPFNETTARIIGKLCESHSGDYDPFEIVHAGGAKIRIGLMASLLRIADAMDMAVGRNADEEDIELIKKHREESHIHHASLRPIKGVRLLIRNNQITIEVFAEDAKLAGSQILNLCREVSETPMCWGTTVHSVRRSVGPQTQVKPSYRRALIISYFGLHGIISAAITKNNFLAKGIEADIICGSKTTNNVIDFWKNGFPKIDIAPYDVIVFTHLPIDILDPQLALLKLAPVKNMGKDVFYSHHLETDLNILPSMINAGVQVAIGDPSTCFFGDALTEDMFFWARMSAICNRDRNQLRVELTPEEDKIHEGLEVLFFKMINEEGFLSTEEVIAHIIADHREFFTNYASELDELYDIEDIIVETNGKVILIDNVSGISGRLLYPLVEKIQSQAGYERLGRKPRLKYPYGIVKRTRDNKVSVLFQSAWQTDDLPIKYLIPYEEDELIGSEHSVWVNFSNSENAKQAIDETIENINSLSV